MRRKLAGFAIIAATLLGVLALGGLTRLRPGRALRPETAPPEPPAQGSCGVLVRAEFIATGSVRNCTLPRWSAFLAGRRRPSPLVPSFGSCTEAARALRRIAARAGRRRAPRIESMVTARSLSAVGHLGSEWDEPGQIGPGGCAWSYRSDLRHGRGTQGVSDRWRLNGSAVGRSSTVPGSTTPRIWLIVGCSTPHIGEVVGTQRIPQQRRSRRAPRSDGIRQASCVAAAAVLTGAVLTPPMPEPCASTCCPSRAPGGWHR